VKADRLVLFTEHFPNQDGGIAQWAYGIAKNLALESVIVDVFAPKKCFKRGASDPNPASLSVMSGRNWHDMRNLYMFYYTLKVLLLRGRVPFLCACWDMATVPVLFSKLLRFPVYVAAHGLEVARVKGGLGKRLMRFALAGSAGVMAGSAYTGKLVAETVGSRYRVHVLGYGVNPQVFTPAPKPSYLIERYGLSDKKVILTLARITERKGHDIMLRALPTVLKSCPNLVYVIAGTGGHQRNLEKLAHDLELDDHVLFCGYVPNEELADHYNLCDVYVMASFEIAVKGDVEGFGITYLEAGSSGKPVVACATGGVTDAVEHEVNGLVVPPGDSDSLAAALLRVLEDSDLAERLAAAGRKRVEQTYNWRSIARQTKAAMEF
jgi:phosphatidylinositol alpha-1,6-mannosyltransferase